MEGIKSISLSVALFVIGAIFLLLAMAGQLSLAGSAFSVGPSLIVRVVVGLIGLTFVSLGVYMEFRLRIAIGPASVPAAPAASGSVPGGVTARAEALFHTLDDEGSDAFPKLVKSARRLSILGRTAVNLVSQYQRVFEDLARSGCEIRLLVVDPSAEVAKFLYGSHPEVYLHNFRMASAHLAELKSKHGDRLQVRLMTHAPTVSLIIVEGREAADSLMRVQLYFLHSRVGRDRPIFRVEWEDKWYGVFCDEFEQLWTEGRAWDGISTATLVS